MWWRKNPQSRDKDTQRLDLNKLVDMEAKLEDARRKAIKEINSMKRMMNCPNM